MRLRELKVKIKSLAAEAKIIRHEEQRVASFALAAKNKGREDYRMMHLAYQARLRCHRVNDVRNMTRYSLLAYALIRGRSYESQESKGRRPQAPDYGAAVLASKVVDIASRFGDRKYEFQEVIDWICAKEVATRT